MSPKCTIDPGFEDAHATLMYAYIQKHMYAQGRVRPNISWPNKRDKLLLESSPPARLGLKTCARLCHARQPPRIRPDCRCGSLFALFATMTPHRSRQGSVMPGTRRPSAR